MSTLPRARCHAGALLPHNPSAREEDPRRAPPSRVRCRRRLSLPHLPTLDTTKGADHSLKKLKARAVKVKKPQNKARGRKLLEGVNIY